MLELGHDVICSEPTWHRISARDRNIITLAQHKLRGTRVDFAEAVRALRAAVEESIPAGRTFLLGSAEHGPVIGSIISGVGITCSTAGILLVRVERDGHRTPLGRFAP